MPENSFGRGIIPVLKCDSRRGKDGKSVSRHLVVILLVVIAAGAVRAEDIHAYDVRMAEKRAAEAESRVQALLLKAARTDLSCPACAELMNQFVQGYSNLTRQFGRRIRPRAEIRERPRQAFRTEYALADKAVVNWNALHFSFERVATGSSLCGNCSPAAADRRIKDLSKEFGGDNSSTVILDSLIKAIERLFGVAMTFRRREYDPDFAARFDAVFHRWVGNVQPEALTLISERVNAIAVTMLRKSIAPVQYYKNPMISESTRVKTILRETGIQAFVLYDAAVSGNDPTYLMPVFFVRVLDRPGILIHEEAHLTANTTDSGARMAGYMGRMPERQTLPYKKALYDSYTFEYLMEDLGRLK